MERIRRSFTFSSRNRQREQRDDSRRASIGHKSDENGVENPEAPCSSSHTDDRLQGGKVRRHRVFTHARRDVAAASFAVALYAVGRDCGFLRVEIVKKRREKGSECERVYGGVSDCKGVIYT